MKIEFNVDDDFVTDLVVMSLKKEYESSEDDEDQLRNAIDIVLEYYMDPQQWADWNKDKVF